MSNQKFNAIVKLIMSTFAVFSIQCISGISTASIFSLIIFVGVYLIYGQEKIGNHIVFKLLSAVFSVITVVCTSEQIREYYSHFDDDKYEYIMTWIAVAVALIGLCYLFNMCIRIFLYHFNKVQIMDLSSRRFKKNELKKFWWFMFGICLIAWMPYFIFNYPGTLTNDSFNQMRQVMGISGYGNHHPVVHTLLIKVIYDIVFCFTNNVTFAVGINMLFQMIVLAGVVASALTHLYKIGVKKIVCMIALIYYAIIPFNAMHSVSMMKDVLFSAFVFVFVYIIFLLVREDLIKKNLYQIDKKIILFYFTAVLVSLFRTNGWYAILICVPILLIVLKRYWKVMGPVYVLVLLTVSLIKGPVMQHFNVSQPDFVESLSIPIQQVARVHVKNGSITEAQYNELSKIIDIDKARVEYKEYISDPIKNLIREYNQQYLVDNKGQFLEMWIEIGLKNPIIYIEAFIEQTKGYYYPDVQYWTVLRGVPNNNLGIQVTDLFYSFIGESLLTFAVHWNKFLPILGLLASIGTMVWLMWILIGNCIYNKEYIKVVFFIPLVAIWLTLLIATPVFAEFRYIYALFFTMPLLIIITLFDFDKDRIIEESEL